MKGAKPSEYPSSYTGYVAGPTPCPNCFASNAKWMSAFDLVGKCTCRVECDICHLNMTHEKDFTSYPLAEYHYQRRCWNWWGEMTDILYTEKRKRKLELGIKDAGSTVHSEVLGAGDTLLLPDNDRKLIGSD